MVVLAGLVPLVIIISLAGIITWIKLMKRKRIGMEVKKDPAVLARDNNQAVSISYYASRNSNISETSSIHDNNRDSYIETFSNVSLSEHPKNSHATDI